MKYTSVILSKRRNPEINNERFDNTRFFKYYELDKNNKIPKYYISFTSSMSGDKEKNRPVFTDSKIGINPNSEYDTPIGVYTYPVPYIYKDFKNKTVPFASEQPYIIVLELKTDKILHWDYYSQTDYEKDLSKLKSIYIRNKDKFINNLQRVKSFLIRKFNNLSNFTFENSFDGIKKLAEYLGQQLADINKRKENFKDTFWWLTRIVSLFLNNVKENTVKWNKVLTTLGYEVIIDSGNGIIHPSEKMQAVFLTPKSYKRIDSIKNDGFNFILIQGEPYDPKNLPKNLIVKGNLDFSKYSDYKLPDNLTIKGSLNLSGYGYDKLPKGLKVGKDLILQHSKIKDLSDIKISGKLDIYFCTLDKINNVQYGSCFLKDSNVLELDGKLYPIHRLKNYIHYDDLDFSNTKISILPDNLTIEGDLNISNTKISILPDNLLVKDYLDISGCNIKKIGKNIKYRKIITKNSNVVEKDGKLIIKD